MITYNEASAIANKCLVDLQEDVGALKVTEVRKNPLDGFISVRSQNFWRQEL